MANRDPNHNSNRYSLKQAVTLLLVMVGAMVLLPAVLSQTAEYPETLRKYYSDRESVYWDVRQISISPIFDEPETSQVELYFQRPDRLFIKSSGQQVYSDGDTVWTYLMKHAQIQMAVNRQVFNPFDFLDSSRTLYEVMSADQGSVALRSIDQTMEPDSLNIYFNEEGSITEIDYLDVNDNKVIFELAKESFSEPIPDDIFVMKRPEGVELIIINE